MTQALALRPEEAEALAPVHIKPPRELYPSRDTMSVIVAIAKNTPAAQGHATPSGITPGQAFAIMVAGWEIGVGPMTSLRHITAINGRTEPDAQLMQGICLAYDSTCEFRWPEPINSEQATVELWRKGRKVITGTYTVEDAMRAGQWTPLTRRKVASWHRNDNGKNVPTYAKDANGDYIEETINGPWQTHPQLMLAYNAIKIACKLGAPDLINRVGGAMGELSGEATAAAFSQMPGSNDDDLEGYGDMAGEPDFVVVKDEPRQATSTNWGDGGRKTYNAREVSEALGAALATSGKDVEAVRIAVQGRGEETLVPDIIRWLTSHPDETVESIVGRA